MRLTLRTLLAYLDNTLDAQDATILRQKVAESGFASQLVHRIRRSLDDTTLSASSPDAVGPIHDANLISEYLDSTLPDQQLAEIEKACLELDPSLAEVAACHQILTLVLGQPAQVPPALRERIYELPDREVERIAAARENFSSVTIAPDAEANPLAPDAPTVNSPLTAPPASQAPVLPVGPTDSGVSDAPARIRESGLHRAVSPEDLSIAGQRRSIDNGGLYGGSIRPSRITPWLVSLGLAAVLLFAIAQIFRPLLNRSAKDTDAVAELDEPIPLNDLGPSSDDDQGSIIESAGGSILSEGPLGQLDDAPEDAGSPAEADLAVGKGVVNAEEDQQVAADVESDGSGEMEAADTVAQVEEPEPDLVDASDPAEKVAMVDVQPTEPMDASSEIAVKEAPEDDVVPDDTDVAAGDLVALIDVQDQIVVAMVEPSQWSKVGVGQGIPAKTPIVVLPQFRAQLTLPQSSKQASSNDVTAEDPGIQGARIELMGPANFQWVLTRDGTTGIVSEFGRFLVTTKTANAELSMLLGGVPIDIEASDEETKAVIEIRYDRDAGADPMDESNRTVAIDVYAVQGNLVVQTEQSRSEISTGQQWAGGSKESNSVADVDLPDWANSTEDDLSTLERSARDGLIALTDDGGSIERSLREATAFRRSEVAALAAQSLLHLGSADVFFGGDGILNSEKQRQYWAEHIESLIRMMNRGPQSATLLQRAIGRMNLANAGHLFRLIRGYSQSQLASGGDAELVRLLDSDFMSVRALAIDNLRRITGETLLFRAEIDTAARRAATIKKWVVRQEKGDIRWPE